jgi:CheY-like chemotaxis protein
MQSTSSPKEFKTILVVDDDRDLRKMLVLSLEARLPVRVLSASHGSTAIHLACQETPDLILIDIVMPDVDGLEITRRLKADPVTRDIPVIAVTSLCQEPGVPEKAAAAGCLRCLDKAHVMESLSELTGLISSTVNEGERGEEVRERT